MTNSDALKALSDSIIKLASAIETISLRLSMVELIATVALSDSKNFDDTLAKLEKGLEAGATTMLFLPVSDHNIVQFRLLMEEKIKFLREHKELLLRDHE